MNKIRVAPPQDLVDLIPAYLAACQEHVRAARAALEQEDYASVRTAGHKMKGTGSSYGFHGITTLGSALEAAAQNRDPEQTREQCDALQDYLSRVEIVDSEGPAGL